MYQQFDAVETARLAREALQKALAPEMQMQKAFTQSATATTGLTMYSLEAPAKLLYPVITPLRNKIPRVGGGQGIQANWKAITAINTGNVSIGVAEGNRGGVLSTTVVDYFAAFKSMGVEDWVSYEAQRAAEGFDDARARAVQGNLRSLMIGEERVILAGQSTFGLGTTPTPSIANSTTGGALATGQTIFVRCVALTLEGYLSAIAGGANPVRALVSRQNADGTTDTFGGGSAMASAAVNVATGPGSTNQVSCIVTPVVGAVGYAWFVGNVAGDANLRLHSVTTINSVVINTVPTTTQVFPTDLATNDRSANALIHDGFSAITARSNSGALWRTMPSGAAGVGTPLTAAGDGGIAEIDSVLQWYWDTLRMSPTEMWVNAQEMASFRRRTLAGAATSMQRFTFQAQQGAIVAGGAIRGYINQFAMDGSVEVPVRLHPNVPPGTIFFLSHEIPYSLSGVSNVNQILERQGYHQIEWPKRSRRYEYGVYTDQVLQCYYPPAQVVLSNIAPS